MNKLIRQLPSLNICGFTEARISACK